MKAGDIHIRVGFCSNDVGGAFGKVREGENSCGIRVWFYIGVSDSRISKAYVIAEFFRSFFFFVWTWESFTAVFPPPGSPR